MGGKFINDDGFDVLVYVELGDRGKPARVSRITGRASVQGGKDG